MNAGGVDKACKSNDFFFSSNTEKEIVANELVTPWYVP